MDISDIRNCAEYYKRSFLETFYILTTYSGRCFVLVANKNNFPHLMGISKSKYQSNGYRSGNKLFDDIINNQAVSTAIIPRTISTTSKMYKKCLHFCDSQRLFWNNSGPVSINYNPAKSSLCLNHVDILISDLQSGYSMGWVKDSDIPINSESKIKKYCISSWIDENGSSYAQKEKYMPNQDIDILRQVIALDSNSEMLKEKSYVYSAAEKEDILLSIARNHSNLLLDNRNKQYYASIAVQKGIHCKINGVQF